MAKTRGDFTDILVRSRSSAPISSTRPRPSQQQTGAKIQDALVKLGYATPTTS